MDDGDGPVRRALHDARLDGDRLGLRREHRREARVGRDLNVAARIERHRDPALR
jgi:hypothetical protein